MTGGQARDYLLSANQQTICLIQTVSKYRLIRQGVADENTDRKPGLRPL